MINFRSQITQKVLGYFLLNTESEMYLNEIAKKFEVDRGNLTRKLEEWKNEKILNKRKQGNLSIYSINKKYLFLKELKNIFLKSIGFEVELRNKLKQIKGIEKIIIFGSYTKNKLNSESDIDILIIGSHKFIEVQRIIIKFQKKYDREINVIDMTKKEFNLKKNDNFLKNIFENKYIEII